MYWQDDIVLGKKLGEGSFGSVYRVSLANKPSKPKVCFTKSSVSFKIWRISSFSGNMFYA